jgi:16S rRNA (adenine1518-N6/adenine1519-N6)-dimethyltransferase
MQPQGRETLGIKTVSEGVVRVKECPFCLLRFNHKLAFVILLSPQRARICRHCPRLLHYFAMARQRMGQHFLSDPGWQQRIFGTLPRNPSDVWVEIGAGHGEMTRILATQSRRVIAIEGDPPLAEHLRRSIKANPSEWPGVEVVGADVLDCDLASLAGERFHVYGNLPYYITSPILHRLFGWADKIASIHIVIQLEVALRIVAHPESRAYGYLSTICQFYAKPQIALKIPPGAFRPPPKVNSALVQMELPGERATLGICADNERGFLEFIQQCFGQKRKTLRNNLRSTIPDEQIRDALLCCNTRPDARAEQLTLAQFAALFTRLR